MLNRLFAAILVSVMMFICVNVSAEESKANTDAVVKALDANKLASAKVKAFVKNKLIPLCTDEVLIKETKAQNAKKVSLDEIKKIDKEWKDAEDELDIQVEKTSNACAKRIKEFVKKTPAIVEAFAMDNQGANVGQNALTGDYWQGDEAKWKNSFNGGKGGVDVGKIEFDKSANAQLQQVSLPLIDKDGKVIGAITYGINTDKL